MEVKGCSIDKLTIVGELKTDLEPLFQNVINDSRHVYLSKSMTSLAEGKFFNDLDNSIYFSFDAIRGKLLERRNFRMEFNPSKINSEQSVFIKKEIMPLLTDVGFSRMDIALDVSEDLSNYHIEITGRKRGIYLGRDGSLETLYIGTRRSNVMIRLYDKKKQLLEEEKKEIEDKVLWRLEYELRGSDVIELLMENGFENIIDSRIIRYDYSSLSPIDTILVKAMIDMPNDFSKLSKTKRYDIRKKSKLCAGDDVAPILRKEVKKNNPLILSELKGYTQNSIRIFQ